MSFLWRWLKRGTLAALVLVVLLLAPLGYNELACRSTLEPAPYTSLLPPKHHRAEGRSAMTYPEWHIVHAYDDYAQVIATGDPHDFGYLRAIAGFWSSLCALSKGAGAQGGFSGGVKGTIYVIGVSFTLELLAKAAYEETLGRLTTRLRGADHSALDQVSGSQARAYANFLQQAPWYRWDFRSANAELSKAGAGGFRDLERGTALRIENSVKAVYADAIASAVASTGFDEPSLRMIVTGYAGDLDGVTRITEQLEGAELETPRYRALTHLMVKMAAQGVDFVEIAGNDDIMLTVITDTPEFADAFASLPRQGYGDTRHLVMLKISDLGARLRDYAAFGVRVEHIHDY